MPAYTPTQIPSGETICAKVAALPTLLVDTREKKPLSFKHLQAEKETLLSGDYSVRGLADVFAVERKTMADLLRSLSSERKRFMHELHRLRGFANARLLVIGTQTELYVLLRSRGVSLNMVEHSLLSIEQRFQLPVHRVNTADEAACLVESWAFVAWRNAAAKLGIELPYPHWVQGTLAPGKRTNDEHARRL